MGKSIIPGTQTLADNTLLDSVSQTLQIPVSPAAAKLLERGQLGR